MGCCDEPRGLPACPAPRDDESLLGYLLGLAELNGYRSLKRVLGIAGHRTMPRKMSALDLLRLAELVRQPETLLKERSYEVLGRGRTRFIGNDVSSFAVEVNRPRFCLECLNEEFKFRTTWDLSLMVCCPDHGGYLLAECPDCNNFIDWGRPSWELCSCGYDLSEVKPVSAPGDVKEVCRYLRDSFLGRGPVLDLDGCAVIDKKVSPQSLMILTALLGSWYMQERHIPLDKVFSKKTMAERASYITATVDILRGWPDTFYGFLNKVAGKDPYPDSTVLMYRDFGRLYYNLMYVYKNSDLDFVRTALKEYDIKRRDDLVSEGLSAEEINKLGFNGAAKDVDFSAAALKKMAQSGGVSFRKLKPVRSAGKIELTDKSRKDLSDRKKDRIRYMEVVKMLGIRPPLARKLIDGGMIKKDKKTVLDGRGNESYSCKEVNSLLAKLKKLTKPMTEAEGGAKLYSLPKAFHVYGRKDGMAANEILSEVLGGRLTVYRKGDDVNLASLRVCSDQLSTLIASRVIGAEKNLVGFRSAMNEFGLTKAKLETILRRGDAEHVRRPFGGVNYILIDRASLKTCLACL